MKTEVRNKIALLFSKQSENFKFDWQNEIKNCDSEISSRIEDELLNYGPINSILNLQDVSEVLVNGWDLVHYEKSGVLLKSDDIFYSEQTYNSVLERLAQNCGTYLGREKPFIEAQLNNLRITIIFGEISRGTPILSIRVQPKNSWTLPRLQEKGFLKTSQVLQIKKILAARKNFLVIGSTGTGKTSLLQALLAETKSERNIIIEDTQELQLPNSLSVSLLTRQDPGKTVTDITMDELLTRALRLRPDRLIVGEIRGKEAMSLLLALATGHDGSFGSLHARSAPEALIRLEMLIQMGAPQWNLTSVRKLISMTLKYILVLEKKDGTRQLKEILEICSLEDTGFTLSEADSNQL